MMHGIHVDWHCKNSLSIYGLLCLVNSNFQVFKINVPILVHVHVHKR